MRWVLSIQSAAAITALAMAATAGAQAPATQPAGDKGQPAALSTPTAVNTNSPKAAVKTFVQAEIKGDAKAIRNVLLATTPTEERMATAIAELAVAIADLDRAMIAKFGQDKTEPVMGDQDAVLAEITAKLDRANEAVNGDSATVTSPSDPPPPAAANNQPITPAGSSPQDTMTLRKVNGQWKVSVAEMAKGSTDENVQKTLASIDAAVAGYRSVLADLNSGKLATADAVDGALRDKLLPAGMAPPADNPPGATPGAAPATAPAGR